ncbi:hypothetical protein SERLA73DRAFT_174291 [Serpula lacrymans var. lacrymans S7.3]|uniref:4-dimethylallyltryptophan N-methyltransferase n=1 Tax=Serpula lacrymans var. lacrymans (strain S7.3) TaxID=936435 RepID=F8PF53_SERL3|nr:hypothetical protein SERLA73DRAFT_174291 [Serpula lacrymans var. lacrymans S7.3]
MLEATSTQNLVSFQIPIVDIRTPSCLEETIRKKVVSGLARPYNKKSIPDLLLYNETGLRLFEDLTYQPDYYLTGLEIEILSKHSLKIADSIPVGSLIMELGAGALRKTALILDALEAQKKEVAYLALDLDRPELVRTLGQLNGKYTHVKLGGLWGTYDDGRRWLSENTSDSPRTILWLGSSIGNVKRDDAGDFIRSFGDVLSSKDRFVVAIDSRYHEVDTICRAYNDREGFAERFCLNGIDSFNQLFGRAIIDISCAKYRTVYNEVKGRHEVYYRCTHDFEIRLPGDYPPTFLYEGELILLAHSYKYAAVERESLWLRAGARPEKEWMTDGSYTVTMLSWP